MSRTDNQIWQVTIETPEGQLQTYRSQKIGVNAKSITLDEKVLQIAYLFYVQMRLNPSKLHICSDLFMHTLTFHFGCLTREKGADVVGSMQQLLSYAFSTMQPFSAKKTVINPRWFFPVTSVFEINSGLLIEAVLHGDETMVRNILKTNPDLSQIGSAIDFSGRKFTGTALQAAIACADFAPNKNSTGLCELIAGKLKEQYPDNWHQLFHDQALELYTKSLRFYAKKKSKKIHGLYRRIGEGEKIDPAVIQAEEKRLEAYDRALHSKDLKTIIEAHTNPDSDPTKAEARDAQKDHAFQVDQALINAIANTTDAEIQAVLDNPTIDSPLSNLLKQFRSDFTKLSQEEIIFNPQHLLKMFSAYGVFFTRVAATNLNYKKRELFWRHLAGFAQRYLPANVAQVFADPGLYDMAQESAKNQQSFDFKYGGVYIFPLSFDSNSGLGYKFTTGAGLTRRPPRGASLVAARLGSLAKLMSSKNSKLLELVTQLERACACKPERSCVVS